MRCTLHAQVEAFQTANDASAEAGLKRKPTSSIRRDLIRALSLLLSGRMTVGLGVVRGLECEKALVSDRAESPLIVCPTG